MTNKKTGLPNVIVSEPSDTDKIDSFKEICFSIAVGARHVSPKNFEISVKNGEYEISPINQGQYFMHGIEEKINGLLGDKEFQFSSNVGAHCSSVGDEENRNAKLTISPEAFDFIVGMGEKTYNQIISKKQLGQNI